jgi:hypothetical protein
VPEARKAVERRAVAVDEAGRLPVADVEQKNSLNPVLLLPFSHDFAKQLDEQP